MKFLKTSQRTKPKVSLVLLDWSVRESFHLLHYLSLQDVSRSQFEVIIIEYYSTHSTAVEKFSDQVDTWLLLEMPTECYYHKHLMYNVGIVYAQGEIVVICDSDAMVKPGFIRTIMDAFEKNPDIVLHLDQFRNNRKDLYPFCYPSFDEVTGEGCINYRDGKTTGLVTHIEDPIHARNYGACFCAKRSDLIEIGGADEHIDFVGHICGPYDLTFRLLNLGRREIWHESEFLYHTWHPGQAGADNYLGPHDGRHLSTTSLASLIQRQVKPHFMNPAIAQLQMDPAVATAVVSKIIIHPEYFSILQRSFLESDQQRAWAKQHYQYYAYKGYQITRENSGYSARPFCAALLDLSSMMPADDLDGTRDLDETQDLDGTQDLDRTAKTLSTLTLQSTSWVDLEQQIDRKSGMLSKVYAGVIMLFTVCYQFFHIGKDKLFKRLALKKAKYATQ